jgi:hypothetical protein
MCDGILYKVVTDKIDVILVDCPQGLHGFRGGDIYSVLSAGRTVKLYPRGANPQIDRYSGLIWKGTEKTVYVKIKGIRYRFRVSDVEDVVLNKFPVATAQYCKPSPGWTDGI